LLLYLHNLHVHAHVQGFASVILAIFAKHSWRTGDRDSAVRLAKWAKYIAVTSILMGIITLVVALSITRGRRHHNMMCRRWGNC
jgi:Interferon-induced transmembrane protein